MKFKPDIEEVKKRMEAFWNMETADRALIAVPAPKEKGGHISMFHNPRDLTNAPEALRRYWEDPETIYENTITRLNATYLGGDALPVVFQNYGTSGHCNYFGAVPTYGNDTIWFDPVWASPACAAGSYTRNVLEKHLAVARYLTEHAGDDYFVGMPDSTGSLDALGHLCGEDRVLTALIDEPDDVKAAVKILNGGWAETNEMFYQLSRAHNGGGVHAWMHLLAPGRLQHMTPPFMTRSMRPATKLSTTHAAA